MVRLHCLLDVGEVLGPKLMGGAAHGGEGGVEPAHCLPQEGAVAAPEASAEARLHVLEDAPEGEVCPRQPRRAGSAGTHAQT